MTKDIRVTVVNPAVLPGRWMIRGTVVSVGTPFKAETIDRNIMASCLGAKVIGWTVRVELDAAEDIIAVTVLG